VEGDSEAEHPLTLELCRSGWLGEDQNNAPYENPIDGFFTPSGATSPAFTNLKITAYVQETSSGVAHAIGNTNPDMALSPNPARSIANVTLSKASNTISVY